MDGMNIPIEEGNFRRPVLREKDNTPKLFLILGVIILLSALVGILLTRKPPAPTEKKEVVVEKKEPSPTAKPKIEKSSVKIQVLNGTGTPGQAGIAVKALVEAGYSADNIKTDNADKYDHKTATIDAKPDFEDIAADIKSVLKSSFEDITVQSQKLDGDSEFDIVVTTGGKLFETPTPAVTVTPSASPTPSLTPSPSPTP